MEIVNEAKRDFYQKKYPLKLYFTLRITIEAIPELKTKENLEPTMLGLIADMERLYGVITQSSFGVERMVSRDAKDLSKGAGDPCKEHIHFHGCIEDPCLEILDKFHQSYDCDFVKTKTNYLSNRNKKLWVAVKKTSGLKDSPRGTFMLSWYDNLSKFGDNLLMYPLKQYHCGTDLDKALAEKFYKNDFGEFENWNTLLEYYFKLMWSDGR